MKPQQRLLLPVVAGGYTNTCNVTSIIQEYTEQRQHFQGIYIILFKKIIYNIHHCQEALDPNIRMCLNTQNYLEIKLPYIAYPSKHLHNISYQTSITGTQQRPSL